MSGDLLIVELVAGQWSTRILGDVQPDVDVQQLIEERRQQRTGRQHVQHGEQSNLRHQLLQLVYVASAAAAAAGASYQ